jgi:hypothetical protein
MFLGSPTNVITVMFLGFPMNVKLDYVPRLPEEHKGLMFLGS